MVADHVPIARTRASQAIDDLQGAEGYMPSVAGQTSGAHVGWC